MYNNYWLAVFSKGRLLWCMVSGELRRKVTDMTHMHWLMNCSLQIKQNVSPSEMNGQSVHEIEFQLFYTQGWCWCGSLGARAVFFIIQAPRVTLNQCLVITSILIYHLRRHTFLSRGLGNVTLEPLVTGDDDIQVCVFSSLYQQDEGLCRMPSPGGIRSSEHRLQAPLFIKV